MFELPCIEDLLLEGPGQKQIYKARPSVFSGCPKFKMLALRIDFRRAFPFLSPLTAHFCRCFLGLSLAVYFCLIWQLCFACFGSVFLPDLAVYFLPGLAASSWL